MPPSGQLYWRFKGDKAWKYGYCTNAGSGLLRMGCYNGDTTDGSLVDPLDIEWRSYSTSGV